MSDLDDIANDIRNGNKIDGCDEILCCLSCLGATLASVVVLLTGCLAIYMSRRRVS